MKQPWPSPVPFDYTFDFFELDKLHQMDIAHRSNMKLYKKKQQPPNIIKEGFMIWARAPHCLEEILLSIFFFWGMSQLCWCEPLKLKPCRCRGPSAPATRQSQSQDMDWCHTSVFNSIGWMHWNAAVGQCALHIFSHTKMMTSGRSLDLAALSRPLQSSYTPSHSSQRGPSIPDDGNGTAWDPPPPSLNSTPNFPELTSLAMAEKVALNWGSTPLSERKP